MLVSSLMREAGKVEKSCSCSVFWGNALPVGHVSVSLGGLGTKVGQVAGEKKVVLRRDGKRVAHEGDGVDDQGAGHLA